MGQYKTKTDLAYEALRRGILGGRYPPGTRIVIDQMATEMGTSKVPVREAVVRLAGEGWLQLQPHVGPVVPLLSPDEILETSLIRAIIEGAAVRHSVERTTRPTLLKLRQIVQQLDKAALSDDASYPMLNLAFHSMAFESCPYPALKEMATSFIEKTCRLRTVRFLPAYREESQREHHALLQAIESGDAARAESLTRAHVEHAGQLLWKFAREHAEQIAPGASAQLEP